MHYRIFALQLFEIEKQDKTMIEKNLKDFNNITKEIF